MFDRSLNLYERYCERWDDDRREPGTTPYGITTKFTEGRHFELARFQALAAEAVLRGMGDDPAVEPPPLYAFDPSIGRLAHHHTRLQHGDRGGQQRRIPLRRNRHRPLVRLAPAVISHVGGRAPAAFGVVVRRPDGTLITASSGRAPSTQRSHPLILNKSAGANSRTKRYPSSPHAGPFTEIETAGCRS